MSNNTSQQEPTPTAENGRGGQEISERPISKKSIARTEPQGNNPHYGKLCSNTTIQALALLIVLGMVNLVDLDLVALGINRAELVDQIDVFEDHSELRQGGVHESA